VQFKLSQERFLIPNAVRKNLTKRQFELHPFRQNIIDVKNLSFSFQEIDVGMDKKSKQTKDILPACS